jgi:ribonuclease HII
VGTQRLRDIGYYERQLRQRGFTVVAGVDEAGRGALAGPLVAAAVVLPEDFDLDGLEDSKLLTPLQRERMYGRIVEQASEFSVCRAMPRRIDRAGLHRTNLSLLKGALRRLPVLPEFVLADGFPLRGLRLPCLGVRKGDVITASVAAASVVAKVTRDRIMERYHRRFPEYGFNTNRGYGTRKHWAALDRLGPSPIHRRSFKGVAGRIMEAG